MKMIVSSRDYNLTWASNSDGVLHFPKVLSLEDVKVTVCQQKNLHIDLTKDRSQNPLNEGLVSYPKTITSHRGVLFLMCNSVTSIEKKCN
jgi:hypothetical protein